MKKYSVFIMLLVMGIVYSCNDFQSSVTNYYDMYLGRWDCIMRVSSTTDNFIYKINTNNTVDCAGGNCSGQNLISRTWSYNANSIDIIITYRDENDRVQTGTIKAIMVNNNSIEGNVSYTTGASGTFKANKLPN